MAAGVRKEAEGGRSQHEIVQGLWLCRGLQSSSELDKWRFLNEAFRVFPIPRVKSGVGGKLHPRLSGICFISALFSKGRPVLVGAGLTSALWTAPRTFPGGGEAAGLGQEPEEAA